MLLNSSRKKGHISCLNKIKCKNAEEANLFSRFPDFTPKFKLRRSQFKFQIQTRIRPEGVDGGVLILMHNDLEGQYDDIEFPQNTKDEIIGIIIKGKQQKIDLYCVCISPDKFLYDKTFDFIQGRNKECIISGDLKAIMPDLNGRYNAS